VLPPNACLACHLIFSVHDLQGFVGSMPPFVQREDLAISPCWHIIEGIIFYKKRLPMKTVPLILMVAASLACASLAAKTYRWVDENGVTVYSQSPPPSGAATEIKPPPPPAISPEEAWRKLNAQKQRLEDLREDRELKRQAVNEKKAEDDRLKRNCEAAKRNLAGYIARPHARQKGADGVYRYITEEARQERMKEAKEQIKENCR